MYENFTYETILKKMLHKIPAGINKEEGSILYNALAPAAMELQLMYIELDRILKESFVDTASREYLIRRAAERGLSPKPATFALLRAKSVPVDIDIPLGSKFSKNDLTYVVVKKNGDGDYQIRCEMSGTVANKYFGEIIPVHYIKGLETVQIMELLIPAQEEEDTESFRERYINSFSTKSFGGNKADYKEKIKGIAGVGGCKVERATNKEGEQKGGYVTAIIMNSEYQAPSKELIKLIQDTIDPEVSQGEGDGLAPVGHIVNIIPVQEVPIHIITSIKYHIGYSFQELKSYIEQAIEEYLLELNKNWENANTTIVRISQIEARILRMDGIEDISETKINGIESNFVLERNQIGKRGEVIG